MLIKNNTTSPVTLTHADSTTAEENQENCTGAVSQLVINVASSTANLAKKQADEFINNSKGTHNDRSFTFATCIEYINAGKWLANSQALVQKNRDVKSKKIGLEIRALKKREDEIAKNFAEKYKETNNSEHVIPQNVISARSSGTDQTIRVAQTIRGVLVNNAPAYLENKQAHMHHPGTRWLIATPAKNISDPSKFNTIDRQENIFFDAQGNAFTIVNGGKNKTFEELIAQNKSREKYNAEINTIIKEGQDISAAIQLNQLGYANSEEFANSRANTTDDDINQLADVSYFHMIKEIKQFAWASNNIADKVTYTNEFEITAKEITPKDKIEMILARLTVMNKEYPTAALAKQILKEIGVVIPDKLKELRAPVSDKDKTVPYYALFE